MKKKNYFSGFSARIAFAIIALTGAMLTGCYKDDGLDVNSQIGDIVLPDATYTISGMVVDAETFAPINGAIITGGITTTSVYGGFTASVSRPETYTLFVTAKNYDPITTAVVVEEVNPGQSAVYSTYIAMQPNMTGTYDLDLIVYNNSGSIIPATGYTATVTAVGSSTILSTTGLEGGKTYLVQIVAEGYVDTYVTLELPAIRFDKQNVQKVVPVTLNSVPSGDVQIFGQININGNHFYASAIKLYDASNKLIGIQEGYTYSFLVSEDLFTASATRTASKTATFTFEITAAGITFEVKKTYSVTGESESVVVSDIEIKVNTTVGSAVSTTYGNEVTETPNYTNSSDVAVEYSFNYTSYEGSAVSTASDYAAALEKLNITSTNPFYQPVLVALNVVNATGITAGASKTSSIEVAAASILETFTYIATASEVTSTIDSVTADGEAITTLAGLNGAKSVIDTATGLIEIKNTGIYPISHDHGHGHGHGSGNAGGGIIDPE